MEDHQVVAFLAGQLQRRGHTAFLADRDNSDA